MLGTERILGRPNVRQLITVVFCATAVLLSASAPNKRGCAVKQRGGECRVSCCDVHWCGSPTVLQSYLDVRC